VRTVRAKLLLLVALSVGLTLLALPVLSWLLRKQMTDEANARASMAARAYQTQLDDDLTDLRLAVSVLSSSRMAQTAMKKVDVSTLATMTDVFARLYPDIDIAFVDPNGTLLWRIGCDADGPPLADLAFVKQTLASGESVELSERGCDRHPMPTYIVARRAGDSGIVAVGLDFSEASLARASRKLGVELSLQNRDHNVVNKTKGFPSTHAAFRDRTFVVQSFSPNELRDFELLAAIDVTELRAAIDGNLLLSLGCLFTAAALALIVGLPLAAKISNAVKRLRDGFANPQVKVEGVDTGDEFEDLARCFNHMLDGLHERDRLRATLGKFMTSSVMEHLLAGDVQLGGELLTATIVFSDIRSFTSLSEKMDAHTVVAMLNEYFTEMVDVIALEDGVVDKYIGDAIMAVWGAPIPKADDALRAVRAAVSMREALARLNARLTARGMKAIRTGIGVHTGEVVAGNIGSERRMEYTVIGDAVNVALSLETATKEVGAPVLLSDDTYQLVKRHVQAREAHAVIVKGRPAVRVWALTGVD
jgi:adenylate cyclase